MVSAPELARPTTFAREACACNRKDEKSAVLSGARTDPTTLPPFLMTKAEVIVLKFLSEDIIGSNEKPAVIARLHCRFTRAPGERVVVIGVVDGVGRTVFVGQAPRGRSVHDEDLIALLRDFVHGERRPPTRRHRGSSRRPDRRTIAGPASRQGRPCSDGRRRRSLSDAPAPLPPKSSTAMRAAVTATLAADVGIGPRHVEQQAELQRRLR